MDKYEYKIRSDEIKSLIAQGDYTQAAEIADTIDWRRVKSVMMLCTISDLYKINRRYEDAKNMLLLAYERRPGGRTICYSLCELCIKMEDVVQALKYYKEFVQVAPKDTGRYILQYKIYEAQDVSLEERIGVLEEMKKRDYREKWAYELAYLYHRMGLATQCVEECDELILWFGDGKYVVKAMELKMLHQPLTPAQQEIYDRRFEEIPEETDQGVGDSGIYEESADYGQQSDIDQESYGWASEDGQFMGDGQEDGLPGYDGDFAQPEYGRSGDRNERLAGENGERPSEIEERSSKELDERSSREMDERSSEELDDLDIHVKTMDVGKYNTINLQAELAAGLQEVLGAEEAAYFGQENEGQPEADAVREQEEYEDLAVEEMEESEVFFGATGEIEDMPYDGAEAGEEYVDDAGAALVQGEDAEEELSVWGPGESGLPESPSDEYSVAQSWQSTGRPGDMKDFAERQPGAAETWGRQTRERQPDAAEAVERQMREQQSGAADIGERQMQQPGTADVERRQLTGQRHDVIDFAERQLAVEKKKSVPDSGRQQSPEQQPPADEVAGQQPTGQQPAADEVAGQQPAGQQSVAVDAAQSQASRGRTPETADSADRPDDREGSSGDETARQVMEQLRTESTEGQGVQSLSAQPPKELAEVLSQEANGQISFVLPESVAIEKQITGQMKIDDILIEWERMKKENEEKRKEEVRKHILNQTGPMFTEFEAAVRDGLLEQLEKEAADKAGSDRNKQVPAKERKNPVQDQDESGADEAVGALVEAAVGTVSENGAQQAKAGPDGAKDSEYGQGAPADGLEYIERTDARTGLEDAENGGSPEEPKYMEEAGLENESGYQERTDYEDFPEYIEDGNLEGKTAYADDTGLEDESAYGEDSDFGETPGDAEETEYEDGYDFREVTDYIEEADFKEAAEEEEGLGRLEDFGAEEAKYTEETDHDQTATSDPEDAGEAVYEAGDDEFGNEAEEAGEAVYDAGDDEFGNEAEDAGEAVYEAGDDEFGNEAEEAGEAVYDAEDDEFGNAEEDDFYENEDDIQEDDIIEEIEEMQKQTGKADKRPKPAKLKKQKEEASEKEEEQPIERDQAKVRSLSREEKELFAPFIQSRHSKEQLITAIDSLSMAAYTGNLIITGDEGMDMLTLAKNIVRDVRVTDRNFSGKVAKITGQGLNDRKIDETLEQLNNGALLVETASGMKPETAAKLHRALQQERVGIIVIMVDTKKAMKKLFLGTPELYGDFPARIDLEALSNDTLVSFGKQYAREMEYSIDELGMLALHTRIEELQTIDHVVTVAEVKQIVDEAIHHASRKTLGHFFDVLLARRYDDEDMIILTEKDFVA